MSLKDYKCVRQDNLKDCGVSALLSIIQYYHGDMSKEELLVLTNTTKSGVDLFSLQEAARKIGFDSAGVKANFDDIGKEHLPCIAHVIIKKKYKHFIVIFEINTRGKYLIIGDPTSGIKKVSFSYFNEISTKYFLLLKPVKPIPKVNGSEKINTFLFRCLFHYRNIYFVITVIALFIILFRIVSAYHFKWLFDLAISNHSYYNAYNLSLLVLILLFLKNFSTYIKNNLISYLDHKLSKQMLIEIYSHLILLPYLYCKRHTTGEIVTRINDISSLKDIVSKHVIEFLVNFILSFITFIILFHINGTLSFLSLISILIYFLISILYNPILNRLIYTTEELHSKVNTHIIESFEGIDTVKNLHLENRFITNLKIKYMHLLNNNYQLLKFYNREVGIKNFFRDALKSIALLIGVLFVMDKKIRIGDLLVFVSLEDYFYDPLKNNIDYRLDLIKGKYSFGRIKDLLKVRKEEDVSCNTKEKIKQIRINNLCFSYHYKKKILKNLSFSIDSNDRIMLKGASGSGKTTLVKILLKYIDIKRNMVFMNQLDLCDCDLSFIRNKICFISQNEFIFSDTLINNIIMHRDISYDTFLKVSKLTLVNEIISDSDVGYDLLLEENGFNLSGGERQRIILTRSMLNDADVYILDESLGEVDIKKERTILKNLFHFYKDKIFIVISHRNNNLDLFNKVVTLREGMLYNE